MAETKTVRFVELVEKGGRPEVHLSWSAPAKDPELQRAAKQHRVVTLHQQWRGTQKDFGVVALELGKDVQFLVFPKTLKTFAGRRVVGIKYELFGDAPAAPTVKPKQSAKKPSTRRTAQTAPRPRQTEVADDRVIAFPGATNAPEGASETKKIAEAESIDVPDATVESIEPPEDSKGGVKAEVRKALAALNKGRVAEAKRRLRTILDA